MYYYMFSEGQYSDYHVGGLYYSDKEYSHQDFKSIYKEYIKELFPNIVEEISMKGLSNMSCPYAISRLILGSNPFSRRSEPELHSGFEQKHYELIESLRQTVISPEEYFVSKGLIIKLEYTEIWGDE